MRTVSSTSSSVIPVRRRLTRAALERIDATRVRVAAHLGLLDETRSSSHSAALGSVALQRFAHDLLRARADLEREAASIAVVAFRDGQSGEPHSTSPPRPSSRPKVYANQLRFTSP